MSSFSSEHNPELLMAGCHTHSSTDRCSGKSNKADDTVLEKLERDPITEMYLGQVEVTLNLKFVSSAALFSLFSKMHGRWTDSIFII